MKVFRDYLRKYFGRKWYHILGAGKFENILTTDSSYYSFNSFYTLNYLKIGILWCETTYWVPITKLVGDTKFLCIVTEKPGTVKPQPSPFWGTQNGESTVRFPSGICLVPPVSERERVRQSVKFLLCLMLQSKVVAPGSSVTSSHRLGDTISQQ